MNIPGGIQLAVTALVAVFLAVSAGARPPGPGASVTVWAGNLPNVDNIAFAADGTLYLTLERITPLGKVLKISGGSVTKVLGGLHRPDGLLLDNDALFLTEEVRSGRVLRMDLATGDTTVLARLRSPEGIDRLPNGDLVIAEDAENGRVMQLHRDANGKVRQKVLADGLKRPEGLAVTADGTVLVAETASGKVLAIRDGNPPRIVAEGLNQPDQVEVAPDGSIWISEDAHPGRVLRVKDGDLRVMLKNLNAPQGIAFGPDRAVYISEQGENRILRFVPPAVSIK
ncbi:MAG: hypothetical protein ACE5FN_05265 [Leptospirillia bacterium]